MKALAVAGFGHLQRGVDVDFDELAVVVQVASQLASGAEGEDERCQDDDAGVDHQPGDFGDTTDVLDTVVVGEPDSTELVTLAATAW